MIGWFFKPNNLLNIDKDQEWIKGEKQAFKSHLKIGAKQLVRKIKLKYQDYFNQLIIAGKLKFKIPDLKIA